MTVAFETADTNNFERLLLCIASFMNTRQFREWIFSFTYVEFWHLPILYQNGKEKNNQPTLEFFWSKGEVKVGGKETA